MIRLNRFTGNSITFIALLLLSSGAFLLGQGDQDKEESNAKGSVDLQAPTVVAVEAISLAQQLAAYGQGHNNPVALAVAAQILVDNPTTELDAEKTAEGNGGMSGGDKQGGAAQLEITPSAYLAAASGMSPDRTTRRLIDQVKDRAEAGAGLGFAIGREGGTATHWDKVLAQSTDYYDVTFAGGMSAAVIINGDDDTDLDLYVYDENGNLIGSDVRISDYGAVYFHPRWTGPFRIKIKNLGSVYNRYSLIVR